MGALEIMMLAKLGVTAAIALCLAGCAGLNLGGEGAPKMAMVQIPQAQLAYTLGRLEGTILPQCTGATSAVRSRSPKAQEAMTAVVDCAEFKAASDALKPVALGPPTSSGLQLDAASLAKLLELAMKLAPLAAGAF